MNREFTRNALSITCCDEQLLLHPDKVLYWPAHKTLLVADIHVGKEQTFARAGIPIPGGISENTLDTLMHAVDNSGAERLIILGDLLHAIPDKNESWQQHLASQLQFRTTLSVQVIIGNHDSRAARNNIVANLHWSHTLHETPFVFKHKPGTDKNGYVIAGHIHPVYRLKAGRRQSLKTPVFWFSQQYAVLPAFGRFTGGQLIERGNNDEVFMIGGDTVTRV